MKPELFINKFAIVAWPGINWNRLAGAALLDAGEGVARYLHRAARELAALVDRHQVVAAAQPAARARVAEERVEYQVSDADGSLGDLGGDEVHPVPAVGVGRGLAVAVPGQLDGDPPAMPGDADRVVPEGA